jgi:hypothetical protein
MVLTRTPSIGLAFMTANGAMPPAGATGVLALAVAGVLALASSAKASPLAVAIDDCAEASVAHSRKQNNVGKMILMGESTIIQLSGAWALGLP